MIESLFGAAFNDTVMSPLQTSVAIFSVRREGSTLTLNAFKLKIQNNEIKFWKTTPIHRK